jgi:hypothetical protein
LGGNHKGYQQWVSHRRYWANFTLDSAQARISRTQRDFYPFHLLQLPSSKNSVSAQPFICSRERGTAMTLDLSARKLDRDDALLEAVEAFVRADRIFEDQLSARFLGADRYTWYRALSAVEGKNCRRNDDESRDAALAADMGLKAAHDEYIRLLHIFYRQRDGGAGDAWGRNLKEEPQ